MNTVKYDGYALEFASDNLKRDREIVMAAVKDRRWALRFTSDNLMREK